MKFNWILAAIIALPAGAAAQNALPSGTLLPVSLDRGVKASTVHPGQEIRTRVMQDIPGTSIHRGALVLGHVVAANSSKNGEATLEIRFDTIQEHGQRIPISSNLRALASYLEVEEAQMTEDMSSRGLSPENSTTQQIGGDQVYRGGGPVAVGITTVGQPTPYGVLGPPLAQPDQKCRGAVGDNTQPQAFWLFSTSACGVYGFPDIRIAHAGRTDPAGTIILTARSGKLALNSGSGLLLRVQ
jgi:hypothetical protein